MPAVSSTTPTSDPYLNGLLGSYRWASGNISYSFPLTAVAYEVPYGSNEPLSNFGPLNASQQAAARASLANYAAVANLVFSESTLVNAGFATLRFGLSDTPNTAWAYFPSPAAEGGDVWLNRSSGAYNNPVQGNYAYTTFLHEIGHALGLKHPHEGTAMPADRDFMEYTVMSYRSYAGQAANQGYVNETWGFAQSLMMYDIAAIQSMYGANFSTNSGNTTYSWSPTTGQMFINGVGQAAPGANKIFMTLWDGGGTDTYDFSNYSTNLSIDLRPGMWTTTSASQLVRLSYDGAHIAQGNIANSLLFNGDARSLVENAVGGGGNDTIIGNAADNTLRAGAGNDALQGLEGNDMLIGGEGTDTALFRGNLSQYTVSKVAGGITVRDSVGFRDGFDTLQGIEFIRFADVTYDATSPAGAGVLVARAPGWIVVQVADFNGDAVDDLLWRESATGRHDVWTMRGDRFSSATTVIPAIEGWKVVGAGDFNGDGTDDILWMNLATGRVDNWTIKNGQFASSTTIINSISGWSIVATGDFNGDGTDDLLWGEEATGRVDIWAMRGGAFWTAASIVTTAKGWQITEIGDFNADGTDDLLWRETASGRTDIWTMREGAFSSARTIVPSIDQWEVVGTPDLNADGTSDILWRNETSGRVDAWFMSQNNQVGYTILSASGPYEVGNYGDFDGDGRDSLLIINNADYFVV